MLNGNVHPDFADVASALKRSIAGRAGAGAAVCVYHAGRCVVDVWGGVKDAAGSPWLEDTTALSFSTTKGVLSTLVHILVDQGKAGYDDAISRHWPEFGARGKEQITIRQALCHEAGLYRFSDIVRLPSEMLDWEHMKRLIADAEPVHRPGDAHGYHALTYGWLVGGLIEAVAAKPLQAVLTDELVTPLRLDGMFIGMPSDQLHRRAELIHGRIRPPRPRRGWQETLFGLLEAALGRFGVELAEFNAALMPLSDDFDWNSEAVVRAVIPAANGQFTARSLARMYAMLAQEGELDGVRLLSRERVKQVTAVRSRARDRVLFVPMHWRMGYHRVFTVGVRARQAFGHYGYGGSGGFCDPDRRLAVALTLNFGAGTPMGGIHMPRIARAAIRAADRLH